jgi:hypothetical protein
MFEGTASYAVATASRSFMPGTAVVWSEASATYRQLPPRYRVSGALFIAETPAANAVLTFHPLDRALPVNPQAMVQADGRFEVRTPYFGAGAPAGQYAVTVSQTTERLAAAYSQIAATPLRATVVPGINAFGVWRLAPQSPSAAFVQPHVHQETSHVLSTLMSS